MGLINNDEVDYYSLRKRQKLAIFLITIGPEVASEILKGFEDSEVEWICREISNMSMIDNDIKEHAIEEFKNILTKSTGSIFGGMDFAQRALEISKGDYKAQNILGKITPGGSTTDLIQEICDMEPRQIYNLMFNEQSQTLAFLMTHLSIEKVAEVMTMLPKEKREDVLESMGDMQEASMEMLAKVAEAIRPHLTRQAQHTVRESGGVRMVAELLNLMDKEVAKSFLAKLEEKNPELGQLISKKMFSFEDLKTLSTADLQRVTREIEMSDLVVALKSASDELEKAIMGSISKRAAESLKDELEMLGPVKVKDVDAAQERIIQVVKRLEEEGAIEIDKGGGDVIA